MPLYITCPPHIFAFAASYQAHQELIQAALEQKNRSIFRLTGLAANIDKKDICRHFNNIKQANSHSAMICTKLKREEYHTDKAPPNALCVAKV